MARVSALAEAVATLALSGRLHRTRETIARLEAAVVEARPILRCIARARTGRRLREMMIAERRSDLSGIALAAAEVYRLAHREIAMSGWAVPRQVYLLGYAGLKTAALASGASANWTAIEATAFEAAAHWARLDAAFRGGRIRDRFTRILAALADAIRHQDARRVVLAARRLQSLSRVLATQFAVRRRDDPEILLRRGRGRPVAVLTRARSDRP